MYKDFKTFLLLTHIQTLTSPRGAFAPKKIIVFIGFMVLKTICLSSCFNAKIGFEKYALGPEILSNTCQKSSCQTKPAYIWTFWPISRDPNGKIH